MISMNEKDNNLFDIRLNDLGIRYIRKFATIAQFVFITTVIGSFFFLITGVGRIFTPYDYSEYDFWYVAYVRAYLYIGVAIQVLSVLQVYYFWKLKKLLKESIANKDEILFNDAFKALFQNAVWGLLLGAAVLILGVFDLLFWMYYRI